MEKSQTKMLALIVTLRKELLESYTNPPIDLLQVLDEIQNYIFNTTPDKGGKS